MKLKLGPIILAIEGLTVEDIPMNTRLFLTDEACSANLVYHFHEVDTLPLPGEGWEEIFQRPDIRVWQNNGTLIDEEIVLVPAGQTAEDFNGMVTLTESGEFIWDHIEEARDFNHLVELILEEYDIDQQTASQDATAFLMQLLQAGMVKPSGINW